VRVAAAAVLALAALSLLIPAAPEYDAWAWLTWGREVAHLELSTVDGPAFKPLPVAICALLSPLGGAAPAAWLVVARAGAIAAVLLGGKLAADLAGSGRRTVAAVAAGAGVVLTGGFLRHAAVGDAEPLFLALVLGAWLRHRAGRPEQALALGAAAALIRVEAWPFLAAYAALVAWRRPALRPAAAGLAVAIPAAWFLPELAGSGELLRSGDRALVPNPGAPALAAQPALASLGAALALLPLPLAAAALAGPRALLAAGAAWCGLVALMAEAGFSGEPRYALPGAALIAVAAGAGAARASARRWALAAVLIATAAGLQAREIADLPPRLAAHARLAADLRTVIAEAGGREAVLACGRPAVGRFRGTMLAYALDVRKRDVRADGRPDAITFRSQLTRTASVEPPAAGRVVAAAGRWRVEAACLSERAGRSAAPARAPG
jgi:hypothetical protein